MRITVDYDPNGDPYARFLIVCIDKEWDYRHNCCSGYHSEWTGDYTWVVTGKERFTIDLPETPRYITVVTSSCSPYRNKIRIYVDGREIAEALVNRNQPLVVRFRRVEQISPTVQKPTYTNIRLEGEAILKIEYGETARGAPTAAEVRITTDKTFVMPGTTVKFNVETWLDRPARYGGEVEIELTAELPHNKKTTIGTWRTNITPGTQKVQRTFTWTVPDLGLQPGQTADIVVRAVARWTLKWPVPKA